MLTAHTVWASSLPILTDMALALLLGWVIGYERYFSGRASGSQVYCLVSTTSAAVSLLAGYPGLWYGGANPDAMAGDPTRVVGSILTGIGFLGAWLIVQTGINVRGLSTAASIWSVAAIGILVGVGFYLPAIGLTLLCVLAVELMPRLERLLPAHAVIASTLRFHEGHEPRAEAIQRYLDARGLRMPSDSVAVNYHQGRFEIQCLIVAKAGSRADAMVRLAAELANLPEVESFTVTQASRA